MAAEFATKGRRASPACRCRSSHARPARSRRASSPRPGSGTPPCCSRSRATGCSPTRCGATASRRRARIGPRRNHPVPMPLADLPQLDAVLISHDHYDHLDTATIDIAACAPSRLPVRGARSASASTSAGWGVPDDRIVELDWDESHRVGGLTFTCTEARHFSGRSLGSNTTLWASWVLAGEQRRVFFGGDTGYTPAFAGDRRALRAVRPDHAARSGAYDARWPDVHLNPDEAVRAHRRAARPASCCRSTGPPSTWPSTSGPTRWSGCSRRRRRRRTLPCRPPVAGSTRASCPTSPGGAPPPERHASRGAVRPSTHVTRLSRGGQCTFTT